MNQTRPSLKADELPELVDLVRRLFDQALNPLEIERLEQLVRSRADGRSFYLRTVNLIAGLHLCLAPETQETRTAFKLTPEDPEGSATIFVAEPAPTRQHATADALQVSKLHVKPLTLRFPRATALFSRTALGATLLVALLIYGAFTVIAWKLRPDSLPSRTDGSDVVVATIRDAADVKWSKNTSSKPTASSILTGELLKIESGTMELELNAGTKLVVEGPADWSVDGKNRVSLRAGRLMARVPKQAIGFTVETPTAKIVDLGTEFGIEVSESGATEVQVLQGKIEVHPNGRTSDSSRAKKPIILSAGTAVRVESPHAGGTSTVREITAAPNRFTKHGEPEKSRRIYVSGALASSTFPEDFISVNNLVNGSGLRGECHSSDSPEGNMWHTQVGKIKNEYVLFDLARPHQLESMKVWNFNHHYGDYRFLGVKQADIYVSNGNRGTPLEHPEGWQLVAENVQFELATGTPEYDTPRVIPLGNTTARFVAILIDESWGHDPRVRDEQPEVVGLAEVQFFGTSVKAPSDNKK